MLSPATNTMLNPSVMQHTNLMLIMATISDNRTGFTLRSVTSMGSGEHQLIFGDNVMLPLPTPHSIPTLPSHIHMEDDRLEPFITPPPDMNTSINTPRTCECGNINLEKKKRCNSCAKWRGGK